VNLVEFDELDLLVPAYYILTTAEASSNLSRYDGIRYGHRETGSESDLKEFYSKNRSTAFGVEVKRRIMLGTFVLSAGYYDAYYTKAQQVRRLVKEKLKNIFNSHDVIVMPNSPVKAYPFGSKMADPVTMYLADIYTVMANLAGIPAISLPIYRSVKGQPYGIQVMSDAQNEVILLQVSKNLMKYRI
jgi:aspartyl-tRNA(Asn)/glutamyl-tRNA(Gln) amidotransferase subunit A